MPETRRHQIDALLAESELLQEIFDSIHDGIVVVGEDENIAYTNRTAEKLLGIAKKDMMGVNARELPLSMYFQSGDRMPKDCHPFAAAFGKGTLKGPTQILLKRPDGSTLPVFFNVYRKGKGLTVAILTDQSEMMRRQQQQDDYYRLLAHDLRTPLTVLLGHAELLRGDGEANSKSVRAIHEAGKQLESMTEEMTDRMVLESGHFNLEKKEVKLEVIISDVVAHLPSNKNHRLEVRIQALPPVQADAYRLKRVLTNLITNAMKYSPENTIISVSAWESAKGIIVKVSDQGWGIEAEDLNYIFDSFYITSIGKEKGGVGLGLYIARLIMEAHGGRIYVSSTKEGSSFTIFLPKD